MIKRVKKSQGHISIREKDFDNKLYNEKIRR
jgi:hypothetical protein